MPGPIPCRNAPRTCEISCCDVVMRSGQRVCKEHWLAFPGRTRSRLSMALRGPVADQMWARAIAALEGRLA